MTTYASRSLNILFIKFKIWVFFITMLLTHAVIYEGWHFTLMWKTLAYPHHLTKRAVLAHESSWTPPLFTEVTVPNQNSEWWCIYVCLGYPFFLCFYGFSYGFWNCFDIVIFFFQFITFFDSSVSRKYFRTSGLISFIASMTTSHIVFSQLFFP